MKKTIGFTLAEVLITLSVIGVVAAIAIPNVINECNKIQYAAALKKFYAGFNQAMKLMITNTGCDDMACTNIFNYSPPDNQLDMWNAMKATGTLSIVKDCGIHDGQNCFSQNAKFLNGDYDGSLYSYTNPKAILADGMAIEIFDTGGNCNINQGPEVMNAMCGELWVDVNGLKSPNQWGRDIFSFWITNSGILYPKHGKFDIQCGNVGWCWDSNTVYSCNPQNSQSYGESCAARIIEQGWQMSY